jgi:chromate transport protein ChrA
LIGSIFKAGVKFGVYSVIIIAVIIGWLIFKRKKRKR